jgi:hypothetical protein
MFSWFIPYQLIWIYSRCWKNLKRYRSFLDKYLARDFCLNHPQNSGLITYDNMDLQFNYCIMFKFVSRMPMCFSVFLVSLIFINIVLNLVVIDNLKIMDNLFMRGRWLLSQNIIFYELSVCSNLPLFINMGQSTIASKASTSLINWCHMIWHKHKLLTVSI